MEDYRSVGHTRKTYGLTGALKLEIKDQYLDDLFDVTAVFLSLHGKLIPYFVEEISEEPHLLIKFEEVDSPEQARDLTNAEIFMRSTDLTSTSPVSDEGPTDWEMLEGWTIYNQEEVVGQILEVQEFPQQMMALVDYKGKTILIPLNDNFLEQIEKEEQKLIMQLPEGLLAL